MANHEYKDILVENVSFFIYILILTFHLVNHSEAFIFQCNVLLFSIPAVTSSIANGSASNSSTYIRSQYNLNPPPIGATNPNTSLLSDRLDHHMDISLASPDDLPPPGYDPSLTLTAPSDGPPSTIDPGESSSQVGAGSIVGVSFPNNSMHLNNAMCNTMVGNAVQPPQLPPAYLSSAMSTSSGHSSSNSNSGGSSGNNNQSHHVHNINIHNNRRQSSGSHSSHPMKSFCSSGSSTGLPVIAPVPPTSTTNHNISNSSATMPKSIGTLISNLYLSYSDLIVIID